MELLRRYSLTPQRFWEGGRLAEVLAAELPDISSRTRVLAVRNSLVSRDGRVLGDLDERITIEGGPIEVDLSHGAHGPGKPRHARLIDRIRVLHDDPDIVVVDKAAGIVAQPNDDDEERGRGPSLVELLKHYWKQKNQAVVNPILVQRLDSDTSGLLVVAKNVRAARALQNQLKDRRLKRTYLAIVEGRPTSDSGTWNSMQRRGIDGRRQSIAMKPGGKPVPGKKPAGKLATTHYRMLGRGDGLALLQLDLETGRTHQIRIHCAEAGLPVCGDTLYTRLAERLAEAAEAGPDDSRDRKRGREARIKPERKERKPRNPKAGKALLLHAAAIEFIHPKTGMRMSFGSPQPERFLEKFKVSTRLRDDITRRETRRNPV